MNKTKRNGLQLLLTVLMLSALCLIGIAAADVATANETTIINTTPAGTLPTSYDLRDYGLVTPVRDQGSFGTCWAHGVIGAIESNVLKKGLVPLEDADKLDLSEAQLVYFIVNRNGVTNGTALPGYEDTLNSYADISNISAIYKNGYPSSKAAIYHLAAGLGVTTEDNDELKYVNFINIANGKKLSPELAVSENAYYPKSMMTVDISDRDTVKEYLMKYGAASVSYWSDPTLSLSGYIDENGKKVLIHNCVFDNIYQNNKTLGNHAVTLIGWNDTYSKENFPKFKILDNGTLGEIPTPEHDGAWLIKNSWNNTLQYQEPDGSIKTWDGYAWISYEDSSMGNLIGSQYISSIMGNRWILFYDVVPAKEFYDNIYLYDAGLFDDLDMTAGVDGGFLSNIVADSIGDKQTIATKNVYAAKGPEFITAVGINTMNDNVDYQIQVIVNNVTMSTVSDTAMQEGYYVIDLPEPVFIRTGDIIEIPVEFSRIKTGAEDLGAVVDIAATNLTNPNIQAFITPTGIPGRSYVKYQYETKDFTSTNASELFRAFNINTKELIKIAHNDSVLATLSPEQLDLVNESIKQMILRQLENQSALQKLADEDGWIDLASLPSFKGKNGEFTYGSARIKMFTVDTEEETVTGNEVRLSDTDMVKAIAFTKVAPDSTVYYAENLPNQILPEGDSEVLGGFQIITDGAKKYGTKTALVFRVNATNPEQVTLMYQNRFGTWMHVPTIHLGDNRYLAVTPSLAPLTVVECNQSEDFNPKFRFGSDRFPRLFPTVNTTILTR